MSLSDQNQTSSSFASAATLGKYKILRVIARSNDVVYEALDPSMNRRIAVKELALSTNLSGHQRRERIERFYREAKAAGNLSHPNIVTVFEIGHDGDRHYIAMEYLEGPSLRDILRMRSSLPIREALTATLQLTDALGYAHSQGVVHRDVKPDNIHLVLPNDMVKLTDFGIARILSDPAITSTGQVFGTPSYMSPEQILSKEVDHRTDIFSLGVVLYEMIVGKKPFVGDSVITITYHVMNSQPDIPASLPSGIYNIISRALTKDPNQRYLSMADMAADLHTELAFSDSPYYKTVPPGVLTAKQLSDEHTAMMDRNDFSMHASDLSVLPLKYAPAAGIGDAIAGGPVSAATSVSPLILPHAATEQESTKSALALIGSVVGVMLIVLALVIVIAKAYVTNKIEGERASALRTYNKAAIDLSNHQYDTALAEYRLALAEAPKGSDVAVYAQSAVTQIENRETASDDTEPVESQIVGAPTLPAPALQTQTTTDAGTGISVPSSSNNAEASLDAGQADLNRGDQVDAIAEFAAANTSDPTGDAGKRAGAQLAQIYSDQGDAALQAGHPQTALEDWQLVVKYAPANPLADQARQKILQNGTPGGTLGQTSTTAGQSSTQTTQ